MRLSIINGYCLEQYYCLCQGSEQLKKKLCLREQNV